MGRRLSARRPESLELALYDIRLPGPPGAIVADELRAAAARGVTCDCSTTSTRSARPRSTRRRAPGRRSSHELPIEIRGDTRDPGPDAPQVRRPRPIVGLDRLGQLDDRLVDAPGERGRALDAAAIAAAYGANFEELWDRRDVERSGRVDPRPPEVEAARDPCALVHPGHGEALRRRSRRRSRARGGGSGSPRR